MNSGRYGQHNLKIIGLILGAMVIIPTFVILLSGDRYEDYLGLGEYPNCMKVDEYGDAGNDEGCVRHTRTLTPDYQDVYSLSFETFYMKSEDTAYHKYQTLKESMKSQEVVDKNETNISDVSTVTCYKTSDNQVWFVVKEGTTVYKAHGVNQDMSKKQKWFDVLKINYQVPQMV